MDQKKIDRINELARKAKSGVPLTEEELTERTLLRNEYLEAYRASLTGILDHTVIVRPDGTRERLQPKPTGRKSGEGS
jgi:uncharacterized protein YnzC (UPF0291/DUF896 family)